MARRTFFLLTFIISAALFIAANTAFAKSDEHKIERQTHEIIDTVMSPFCPGRLLRDCPSGPANELKAKIRKRLADGETVEQIRSSIIAQYGEAVRAAPEVAGFGVVAWVAPFTLLLAGFFFIVAWLSRKRDAEDAPAPSQLSDESKKRLEEILRD